MAEFLIIPGGIVNSYRRRSADGFYELDPIRLHNRNAYALPVAVLNVAAFANLRPDLNTFAREELSIESFQWFHEQDDV